MSSFRFLSRLLCIAALTVAATAQEPQPVLPSNAAGVIRLDVVVSAHSGAPVPSLPQSAFSVLDNGKPQPITSFRAVEGQTDAVKILLVVDAVNIPYIQLAYERNQLDAFLKGNDGKLAHPTSVVVFTDTN